MSQRYTMPTDSECIPSDLMEFRTALLHHTAETLALEENEQTYMATMDALSMGEPLTFPNRVSFIGSCVDETIPREDDHERLLIFILWNHFFFTVAPDEYESDNSLAPSVITHENIYREMFAYLENHWREVIAIARYIKDHPVCP